MVNFEQQPSESIDPNADQLAFKTIEGLIMNCHYVCLDGQVEIPKDWLDSVREVLFQRWSGTTKHRPGAGGNTWACEIYHGCATCDEHLSLPCSLLAEANEIGAFLNTTCYSEDPSTFFRMYLFLLSEFTAQLFDIQKLLSLGIGKKPTLISIWANHWAKHRLQILLQHHPLIVFADSHGENWCTVETRIRSEQFIDKCGNKHSTVIIDNEWLSENNDKTLRSEANGPGKPIVVIPPMMEFLEEAIGYFRKFVDACVKDSDKIRRFESSSYQIGC